MNRCFREIFLLLSSLALFAYANDLYALTASRTVYWTGAIAQGACPGGGNVCGSDWQCSSNSWGGWNNGNKSFTDPIGGNGGYITGVSVALQQVDCSPSFVQFFLNGTLLGSYNSTGTNCLCGVACRSFTINYSGSPVYNFGGTNTLTITVANGVICTRSATITLTYSTCTPSSFTKTSPSTVWTGNYDNYWNNPSNWSNGVPGGTTNAYIPNCPTDPMIWDASYSGTVTVFSDDGAQVNWKSGDVSTAILNVQDAF